jgi:hypothetical protein
MMDTRRALIVPKDYFGEFVALRYDEDEAERRRDPVSGRPASREGRGG